GGVYRWQRKGKRPSLWTGMSFAMSGSAFMVGEVLRKLLILLAVTAVLPCGTAHAAGEGEITVLASGAASPVDSSGLPIAFIGAQEIERVQGGDIVRILERIPGVTLSRNGGIGSFTGMRVRGANAEQ